MAFGRGVWEWLSSSHSLPTHIESFPFPFPPIPIPISGSNYITEKYVYCVLNSKQNVKLGPTAEALLIKLTTHQSSSL